MADAATSAVSIPDRGPAVFAVTLATLVVGTFFFIARLVCRTLIVRRVSWDDYFIILAWFLAAGLTIAINIGTRFGLGRYDDNIPEDHRLPLKKTEYVFSVIYNPALMALKTSILVFYLRLSKNTQQVLSVASWIVLVIVNVTGVVLTFMNIFQCSPVKAAFSLYEGEAKCIPLLTVFVCSAPVNIVTDLAILALPIPVLTGMRLPKRQKYILVFTFSLGIFVTIVDVVRIYYLQQAISTIYTTPSSDPSAIFGDSPDFAWNASLSLMWSAMEVNVGMICACIPTLKPLIIKILPAAIVDPDGVSSSELSTYGTNSREKELTQATQNGTINGPPTSSEGTEGGMTPPAQARQPSPTTDQVDMMEFLTTPDMAENQVAANTANEPATRTTWMSRRSRRDNAVYFGFVNLKRPKSMIKTSPSESLRYCIVVSTLFLLWGFSYGLLNTLNNVIASIANMTTVETISLTTVYFGGGYFLGPLIVGEWVLRHDEHARFHRRRHKHRDPVGGFKATFIMGLCIYGTGTIMFWPSAVLTSFPGFLISNFVVGFGLAVLETAANPYLILCGPQQYAETRLLIAQGLQGVATVLSGVLAQKVFFADLNSTSTESSPTSLGLIDVQWTYLAITLFCVALALFFYYMPLPEVRDAELGRAAQRLPVDPQKRSIGGLQLRTVSVVLAVIAQWMYVAGQESMSIFFKNLMVAFLPDSQDEVNVDWPAGLAMSTTNYLLVAHSVFALSRFNAAHMTWLAVKYPKSRLLPSPRTMLTIFSSLTMLFALLCVLVKPTGNPSLIAIPAILFFFAEGPIWPLIFTMGLRGQGDRTKRAAAWLTMGASGPAFWPFVMYGIINARQGSGSAVQMSYVVVVVLQMFVLAYPVLVSLIRDAREMIDPVYRGHIVGSQKSGDRPGLDTIESGRTTRDVSVDLNEIIRERNQFGRRNSTATTGSSGDGILGNMMGRIGGYFGGKKREQRKNSSSTTTTSCQSPRWEHWDQLNMSGGGQQQQQQDGVGNGNERTTTTTTTMGTRTPPTIPEEQ